MKKITSLFFFLFVLLVGLHAQKPLAVITVHNDSKIAREKELVAINWSEILKAAPTIDTANIEIINATTLAQVPFQLEKLGGGDTRNLLLQVSLNARTRQKFHIIKGKASAIKTKTYARYVPERKDDFAWENDKVAFRLYGKALEGTKDDAQGLDIWAKRADELVIDKWYKHGDYHKDHGEGLDFYSVGMTLGAGDIAPFVNGKIVYPKHYRKHEILDNGPLRTTFKLDFDAFEVDGKKMSMSKTYSIDAGSRLNRVEININDEANRNIPFVVGLVTVKQPNGMKYMNAKEGITYYWQSADTKNGTIGVAAMVPSSFEQVFEAEGQLLSLLTASSNIPLVYYNGGAWDKQNQITNEQEWLKYLQGFKQKLLQPLSVKVGK